MSYHENEVFDFIGVLRADTTLKACREYTPSAIQAFYMADEALDGATIIKTLEANEEYDNLSNFLSLNKLGDDHKESYDKETMLTCLGFFAYTQILFCDRFRVVKDIEIQGIERIQHNYRYCDACRALMEGVGGNNQAQHFGGCMDEEGGYPPWMDAGEDLDDDTSEGVDFGTSARN